MSGDHGDEPTYLGRTCKSWGQILGFYICYYAVIAGFWFALFFIYLASDISDDYPRYTGMYSRLGSYPGIVVKPDHDRTHTGTKLYRLNLDYQNFNETLGRDIMGTIYSMDNSGFAARMEQVLRNLRSSGETNEKSVDCIRTKAKHGKTRVVDVKTNKTLKGDQWCHFDPDLNLGDCSRYPFGYAYEFNIRDEAKDPKKEYRKDQLTELYDFNGRRTLSPCFFVKVNRLWEMNVVKAEKNDMKHWPKKLVEKIKKYNGGDNSTLKNLPEMMYIHCKGEYPTDDDLLQGKTWVAREDGTKLRAEEVDRIQYYPDHQGIDLQYFPMRHKDNKENAYVAVKLNNLMVGKMFHLVCQAFYKGHDCDDAVLDDPDLGKVKFQVYLDDDQDYMFN